jgi:hypothetical protein
METSAIGGAMKWLSMATAICLTISSQAFAQTSTEGLGGNTCGQFAQDYKENPKLWELMYFTWATGFMSGLNVGMAAATNSSQNLGSKPIDEQQQFLRTYCDAHPLASYETAAFALARTLGPDHPKPSPNSN